MKARVVITDHDFPIAERAGEFFAAAGAELVVAQCQTPAEVIAAAADAAALLVQYAPINAAVIQQLARCKVIVRYGIGVDNVDLAAAKTHGIPVCNVPDYGIDEVADHTLALILALARQLPQWDARLRGGSGSMAPERRLRALRELTLATAGLGRIARAVLERARAFGFRLAAYARSAPAMTGVVRLSVDELFRQADILSLHLPLTPATKHLVNAARLALMKPTAIIVNTARGELVDTVALAEALQKRRIAGAGLDVFETEPLPADHPLRQCPNALLTPHVAWFSEASLPRLQCLAGEEVVRALRGEPLRNRVTT